MKIKQEVGDEVFTLGALVGFGSGFVVFGLTGNKELASGIGILSGVLFLFALLLWCGKDK